jgi:hypothetical protein
MSSFFIGEIILTDDDVYKVQKNFEMICRLCLYIPEVEVVYSFKKTDPCVMNIKIYTNDRTIKNNQQDSRETLYDGDGG